MTSTAYIIAEPPVLLMKPCERRTQFVFLHHVTFEETLLYFYSSATDQEERLLRTDLGQDAALAPTQWPSVTMWGSSNILTSALVVFDTPPSGVQVLLSARYGQTALQSGSVTGNTWITQGKNTSASLLSLEANSGWSPPPAEVRQLHSLCLLIDSEKWLCQTCKVSTPAAVCGPTRWGNEDFAPDCIL